MRRTSLFFLIFAMASCGPSKEEKGRVLFNSYCASCHMAPEIQSLPKYLWENRVLPEMGLRLGISDSLYDPLKGLPFQEQEAILNTGAYSFTPLIKKEDWKILKEYILNMAPDSLPTSNQNAHRKELHQFRARPLSVDTISTALFTLLKFDPASRLLFLGNKEGYLSEYNFEKDTLITKGRFISGITDFHIKDSTEFVTTVGYLDPSSLASGRIFRKENTKMQTVPDMLHRPVHTLVDDLNNDGEDELVVCEFGDLTGSLSLFVRGQDQQYYKKTILNQPGSTRVLAEDMNDDGKKDLIVLTTQGDESITILFQEADLNFRPEKVIRFSPVYGSSWFELLDYDGDGDRDIITVNGDNADGTYVQKPYHGMRIFLNNGNNDFTEQYFYALNGATRVIAKDFDQDGDIDFALLSTFPDYVNHPEFTFVYLENKDATAYDFEVFTFKDSNFARWFLMDSGDIDQDGDEDIILSAFSYGYTPAPKDLEAVWKEKKVDLMVLENMLLEK